MKWSNHTTINIGVSLALPLLIIIGVVSFLSINRLTDTIRLVTYSHSIVDTLEDVYSQLKDAQRGERGYVLTGNERYLEPYHEALALIEAELSDLQGLLAPNQSSRERLATLKTLVAENLAELDEAITLRRNEGFEASAQAIRSGEGKQLMDSIQRIIVALQDEEEARLGTRTRTAEANARATLAVIGGGSLLEFGLVVFAILLVNRDIAERKRTATALLQARSALEVKVEERTADLVQVNQDLSREIAERRRSEEKLADTLKEMEKSRDDLQFIFDQLRLGTAMIDEQGRVTYLSRNARGMLKQQGKEIIGRRWDEALGISEQNKEQLRTMAELPIDQRLRVPMGIETEDGRRFWMEIEIHDDPRSGHGKIFSLYDVSEIYDLRRQLDEKAQFESMIGKSPLMRRAFQQIQDLARVDSTVLIEGETGTGKELVARALHSAGHRKDGPFVAVNCAGLTDSLLASQLFGHRKGAFTGAIADQEGVFEAAEGGTLFLDEIGDISMTVQTSLLRVLQEMEITRLGESRPRKIDVRVIAATQHDLNEEITEKRFRADLLYRIRVARILIPPLRDRREDIPLLAEWFKLQSRAATGKPVQDMSTDAMRALMSYAWPGNVRELRSAIEFAVIQCKGQVLRADDLPPEIAVRHPSMRVVTTTSPGDGGEEERARVLEALERTGGNRAAAARLLGIGRSTLYRRLADLGIEPS